MTENKELFFKMSMLEQYTKNMQQQIEAIENECSELNLLKNGLEDLKNSTGKEVFSHVGKNIFIKTEIISDELLVSIGGGNFVNKSIPETTKILENQIKKLEKIREELINEIEKLNIEAEKIISSMEKLSN